MAENLVKNVRMFCGFAAKRLCAWGFRATIDYYTIIIIIIIILIIIIIIVIIIIIIIIIIIRGKLITRGKYITKHRLTLTPTGAESDLNASTNGT